VAERRSPSGWFEDVCWAVANGPTPIVLAVCADLTALRRLVEWLRAGVPSLAPSSVREIAPDQLLQLIEELDDGAERVAFVVDASGGDDAALASRWSAWNLARERIREGLQAPPRRNVLVLLVTLTRMEDVARCAPDLLSISTVLTVSEEPFAVTADDDELLDVYRQDQAALEQRYGLTTDEVMAKLIQREPVTIPAEDLRRWEEIAQALRALPPR